MGPALAHKKWDKVKGARQPIGRRARCKFREEQRSTTEAAMWMAVMAMSMASGAGATSWAAPAAGMAAGAGTGVPVAPLAMVAAGVELKRRQRGEAIRNSHTPTTPVWCFLAKNRFLVDHTNFQTTHALFLLLSG